MVSQLPEENNINTRRCKLFEPLSLSELFVQKSVRLHTYCLAGIILQMFRHCLCLAAKAIMCLCQK